MSDVVIRAEGLGKKYTIGHQSEKERYYALRDVMARNVKNLWKGAKDLWSGNPVIQGAELEEFWALKDVSFEIKQGEAVGIIGRNGAGKSTLLKVLSRITEPSAGKVTIKGRVASLLEVGTGFHPELTGRENIFLNGAILGMSRKEIKSKFDEIVDFAEIEKFLDTPVKRYSSGMYVRLAFAVAAHLEPEILLVDEVLAVGDVDFHKKCLDKMDTVSKAGRTVLFVSHNMGMITSLCNRAILIGEGRIAMEGQATTVVNGYYFGDSNGPSMLDFSSSSRKVGDDKARLVKAWTCNLQDELISEIDIRHPFKIKLVYETLRKVETRYWPFVRIKGSDGQIVMCSSARGLNGVEKGVYEAACLIPGHLLNNRTYTLDIALSFLRPTVHSSFLMEGALSITVFDPIDETIESMRNGFSGPIPGEVRPLLDWEVKKLA